MLAVMGTEVGSLKKITADFIEDYQSEVDSPQLLLQRIVSYEASPSTAPM